MKRYIKIIAIIILVITLLFLFIFKQVFTVNYQAPEIETQNNNLIDEIIKKINPLSILIGQIEVSLDEEFINSYLEAELKKKNHYQDSFSILGIKNTIKIENLWVNITEENIYLYSNISINNKYYSSLKLDFSLSKTEENIIFKLENAKIGNLKISPKMVFLLINKIDLTNIYYWKIDSKEQMIILSINYINQEIAEQIHTNVVIFDNITLKGQEMIVKFKVKII